MILEDTKVLTLAMCPFKAGDIIRRIGGDGAVWWFINEDQYVSLELYKYGEREGHKGLYKSENTPHLIWDGYEKVCTIEELSKAIMQVKL